MIQAAQTLASIDATPSIERIWSSGSAETGSTELSSPVESPSSTNNEIDGEVVHNHTPLTSTPPSECSFAELPYPYLPGSNSIFTKYHELYSENVIAKILRVAYQALSALPEAFPEIVPQDEKSNGTYDLRQAEFWTCGFFPGTMYAILERVVRYPGSIHVPAWVDRQRLHSQLTDLCHEWDRAIRKMDGRTDTHDIGFIVMPALQMDWELHGEKNSLDSIVNAARSLATRYVASARAIRSWDLLKKKDVEILSTEDNMIVIIDSLCNLDLLYYAAHHAQDHALAEIATAHAETLLRSHLRRESTGTSSSAIAYSGQWYSTCHVANLDPHTGIIKDRLTAQGYHRDSTWSRGQAWGILGYAETYMWTKDERFLWAACGLAEYFLFRLENIPQSITRGRKVPLWDFDAPIDDAENPLRDSSAGVIAANGMLILSQALAGQSQFTLSSHFLQAALSIVQDTLDFALAREKARLVTFPYQPIAAEEVVPGSRFDGLLKFGTANNNADAKKRYSNHGLVYGDYYLVLFGNRLLRMGLC
ncbi:hypothetical protein MBLNU13_g04205t1 [Cladosporium sp. NU13]